MYMFPHTKLFVTTSHKITDGFVLVLLVRVPGLRARKSEQEHHALRHAPCKGDTRVARAIVKVLQLLRTFLPLQLQQSHL